MVKPLNFDIEVPKPNLLDLLTDATIKTEGLLPGQTPLRITNDIMRSWSTIQSVPIDWKSPRPDDRKNFFFVEPSQVPLVIRNQFKSYINKPAKYGFTEDSTIEDLIKKFDQQNPKNKIKLLQNGGMNLKTKIKDLGASFDLSKLNPFGATEAMADEVKKPLDFSAIDEITKSKNEGMVLGTIQKVLQSEIGQSLTKIFSGGMSLDESLALKDMTLKDLAMIPDDLAKSTRFAGKLIISELGDDINEVKNFMSNPIKGFNEIIRSKTPEELEKMSEKFKDIDPEGKEALIRTVGRVLKPIGRVIEGARATIGAGLDALTDKDAEKKSFDDIIATGVRGILKPEEVKTLTSRIPFQEWERGGTTKTESVVRLTPRAITEALETFAIAELTLGLPSKLKNLKRSAAEKELGQYSDYLKMNRDNIKEWIASKGGFNRNAIGGDVDKIIDDMIDTFVVKFKQNPAMMNKLVDSQSYGKMFFGKLSDETATLRFAMEKAPLKSNLQAIAEAKIPGMVAGQQAINTLLNAGLSKEEIEFSGVENFLKGKDKVSKEELVDYIEKNKVKIEPKILSNAGPNKEVAALKQKNDLATEELRNLTERIGGTPYMSGMPLRWMYKDDKGNPTDVPKQYESTLNKITDIQKKYEDYQESIGDDYFSPLPAKYEQYTLPGGTNYQETLLTLPGKELKTLPEGYGLIHDYNAKEGREWAVVPNEQKHGKALYNWHTTKESAVAEAVANLSRETGRIYKSSHWDEPNVVVHHRSNQRTDAKGNKGTFVEEIQSDWHQAGKKKGYKGSLTFEQEKRAENLWARRPINPYDIREWEKTPEGQEYLKLSEQWNKAGPPNAPFKKTWHELALKDIIRQAVERGDKFVAFINGEQTADRYNLRKYYNKLRVRKDTGEKYTIVGELKNGGVHEVGQVTKKDLDTTFGKPMAERIASQNESYKEYVGEQLESKPKWAYNMYDEILPSAAKKYISKWGAKIEDIQITGVKIGKQAIKYKPNIEVIKVLKKNDMLGFDTPREAIESILEYSDWADRWEVKGTDALIIEGWREEQLGAIEKPVQKGFYLTPTMIKEVKEIGQPLFGSRLAGGIFDKLKEKRGTAGIKGSEPLPDDWEGEPEIFKEIGKPQTENVPSEYKVGYNNKSEISFIKYGKKHIVRVEDLQDYLAKNLGVRTNIGIYSGAVRIDTQTHQSTTAIRRLLSDYDTITLSRGAEAGAESILVGQRKRDYNPSISLPEEHYKSISQNPPKEPPKEPPVAGEEEWEEELPKKEKKSNLFEKVEDIESAKEMIKEGTKQLKEVANNLKSSVIGKIKFTGGEEERMLPKKVFNKDSKAGLDDVATENAEELSILGYDPDGQGLKQFIYDYIGTQGKQGLQPARYNLSDEETIQRLNENKKLLQGVLKLKKKLRQAGTPGQVKSNILKSTGISKEKEMVLTEQQALKLRLQQQSKGAKIGAKEERKRLLQELFIKMKSAKNELEEIKKDFVAYAKEHLGERERGKLLSQLKNIKTKKQLSRAMMYIDKLHDRSMRSEALGELKKTIRNIDFKKLRPEYKGELEKLLNLDLAKISDKKFISLVNTSTYLADNPDNNIPESKLRELERLQKKNISSLTTDEIKLIDNAIKHLIKLHDLKNKLKFGKKYREAKEIVDNAVNNIRRRKAQDIDKNNLSTQNIEEKKIGVVKELMSTQSWNTELVAEILDKESNGIIKEILYDGIDVGCTKQIKFEQDAEDYFKEQIKGINIDNWSERFHVNAKDVDYQVIKLPSGKTITITKGERIAFYLHSLNAKNTRHLLEGGFSFEKSKHITNELTSDDLSEIIDSMTPEERAVADAMHKYFNELQKDSLNETSVELNGWEVAVEDNYFPIRTNALDIKRDNLKMSKNFSHKTLEGMGILKERTNANNSIILEDAFSALYKSIRQSASYYGLAEPLRNAKMLLNDATFRRTVALTYGEQYLRNLDGYLKDVEDVAQNIDLVDKLTLDLINKLDIAVLGINPFVITKQVVSLPAACTILDAQYLMKALTPETVEVMSKYSPQLRLRFTGRVTRELGEIGQVGQCRRFWTGKTALSQGLMQGITSADYQAIGRIWKAVQYETEALFPELTGEAKMQRIAKRTEEIVRKTQPTFDVKDRSPIGRSKSVFVRLATKYSSQRNKNYMMCVRSIEEYNRSQKTAKDKSRFMKSMLVLAVIMPAMIKGIDSIRNFAYGKKPIKKEKRGVNAVLAYFENLLGNVYFVGDAFSALKSKYLNGTYAGFDIENILYSTVNRGIAGIAEAFRTIDQIITQEKYKSGKKRGDEKWITSAIRAIDYNLETISKFKGIPYYTIKKLLSMPKNIYKGIVGNEEQQKTKKLIQAQEEKLDRYKREGKSTASIDRVKRQISTLKSKL